MFLPGTGGIATGNIVLKTTEGYKVYARHNKNEIKEYPIYYIIREQISNMASS